MTMQVYELPQFKVDRSAKPKVENLVKVNGVWMTGEEASKAMTDKKDKP